MSVERVFSHKAILITIDAESLFREMNEQQIKSHREGLEKYKQIAADKLKQGIYENFSSFIGTSNQITGRVPYAVAD